MRKSEKSKNLHLNLLYTYCNFSAVCSNHLASAASTSLDLSFWIHASLTVWQKSARDSSWKIFSDFSSVFELTHETIHYSDSLSSLSYNSFSVKLNCDRICNWMNYLISLYIFSELLIRLLTFTWSVHRSVIWYLILAKQK